MTPAGEQRRGQPRGGTGGADVSEIADVRAETVYEDQYAHRSDAPVGQKALDVQRDAIRRDHRLLRAGGRHRQHRQGIYTLRPDTRTAP